MFKDEKHYHFCNWIIDRWLDEWEAKMNFDCPDSYQLRTYENQAKINQSFCLKPGPGMVQ